MWLFFQKQKQKATCACTFPESWPGHCELLVLKKHQKHLNAEEKSLLSGLSCIRQGALAKTSKCCWCERGAQQHSLQEEKASISIQGCCFWFEDHSHVVYSATATWPMHQLWVGWFWIRSHTREMDRCACVHVHKHMHHKGKLRQLLGIQYKQPHQTCRQTDDYLHDKDLKYSPQTFSPGALPLLSMCAFSPSELVLT